MKTISFLTQTSMKFSFKPPKRVGNYFRPINEESLAVIGKITSVLFLLLYWRSVNKPLSGTLSETMAVLKNTAYTDLLISSILLDFYLFFFRG